MLETYFAKPETVERIGVSWIGSEVERYVGWDGRRGLRCSLYLAAGAACRRFWRVRAPAGSERGR